MANDLVTWSPAVGVVGDDKYNPPGAVKLDGSLDSGNPSGMFAAGTFSSTPTIAEINAATGFNQVVALFNRRRQQYIDAFGSSMTGTGYSGSIPSALSYLSIDQRVTTAAFTALETAVNAIREIEGFAQYTFPAAAAINTRSLGTRLAHLRKACAISGTLTLRYAVPTTGSGNEWAQWRKDRDSPFAEDFNPTNTSRSVVGGAGNPEYRRRLFGLRVPTWLTDSTWIEEAKFPVSIPSGSVAWDLYLHLSNTMDVPINNTAYAANSNFLIGSVPGLGSYDIDWPLDGGGILLDEIDRVSDASGSYLSCIFTASPDLSASITLDNTHPLVLDMGV